MFLDRDFRDYFGRSLERSEKIEFGGIRFLVTAASVGCDAVGRSTFLNL
jgi:hypothetical protein